MTRSTRVPDSFASELPRLVWEDVTTTAFEEALTKASHKKEREDEEDVYEAKRAGYTNSPSSGRDRVSLSPM
eukprot:5731470-Amphidinium_carterae.1